MSDTRSSEDIDAEEAFTRAGYKLLSNANGTIFIVKDGHLRLSTPNVPMDRSHHPDGRDRFPDFVRICRRLKIKLDYEI